MTRVSLILAATALLTLPAVAAPLPSICVADTPMAHDMGAMDMAMPMAPVDQAHQDLMAGMERMDADMAGTGYAEDIDVAFICSMIPHHQGAIDMAKAELVHGDDPWARGMAEKVIAAQEQEIADMLDWLSKLPQ